MEYSTSSVLGNPPGISPVERLESLLTVACNRIESATYKVHNIADKIVGPSPAAAKASDNDTPYCLIAYGTRLQDLIDQLEAALARF